MAMDLNERRFEEFLLPKSTLNARLGPGCYDRETQAPPPKPGQSPNKEKACPTILEQAKQRRPAFAGTGNRSDDKILANGRSQPKNPGPGHYSLRNSSFRHKFVHDQSLKAQLQTSGEEGDEGLTEYYTLERGKILRHVEPMQADQVKREFISHKAQAVLNPGPGSYKVQGGLSNLK